MEKTITKSTNYSMKSILNFSGIAQSFGKSARKNLMLVGSACRSEILSRNFLPLKRGDK